MSSQIHSEEKTKLVPAVCTQCGAALEVDPSQEAAVCKYCGTAFIVEKAIHNYNIQHATIEHADKVTVDMSGTVKSVLDYMGEQARERRAFRREERREQSERERAFIGSFFKNFAVLAGGTMAAWLIAQALGVL